MLRVLAVDDEVLALRRIELLLNDMPGAELVGIARTGEAALKQISRLSPDVVLLDIRMAGADGFDVVRALEGTDLPQIVFVTAFGEFAAQAFDLCAVDYVLKPVHRDRLRVALDKAGRARAAADSGRRIAELLHTVDRLRAARAPGADAQAIWAERRGELVRVEVADIDWIEAEGDYVRLHARGQGYLLRNTLKSFQERLNSQTFIRVRRSALVRRDAVASIRRVEDRDLRIRMNSGHEIRVGRTYVTGLRAMLSARLRP
jgi:DNA-binding LytR/AlgR family response regulator